MTHIIWGTILGYIALALTISLITNLWIKHHLKRTITYPHCLLSDKPITAAYCLLSDKPIIHSYCLMSDKPD